MFLFMVLYFSQMQIVIFSLVVLGFILFIYLFLMHSDVGFFKRLAPFRVHS